MASEKPAKRPLSRPTNPRQCGRPRGCLLCQCRSLSFVRHPVGPTEDARTLSNRSRPPAGRGYGARGCQEADGREGCDPSAANNFRGVLQVLMNFAMDEGWRNDNPVYKIKSMKVRTGAILTGSEIAQFEGALADRLPELVSPSRYTSYTRPAPLRRDQDDLAGYLKRLDPGHAMKTGARLRIKLHPKLCAVLDGAPRKHTRSWSRNLVLHSRRKATGVVQAHHQGRGLPWECACMDCAGGRSAPAR